MKRTLGATSLVCTVILVGVAFVACGNSSSKSQAGASTKLKDGTYLATYSTTDAHGWQEFVQVKVQGGKLSQVTFDAVDAKGNLKTNDQNYNTTMKKVAGTNPIEYTKSLSQALLASQQAPVDGVTGATESSKDFNVLAAEAIKAARNGNSTPVVLPQNATYTATGKASKYGWMPYVQITFTDIQISGVTVDQVKMENNKITARESQDQNRKGTGKSINDVFSTLESELHKTGDPSKVDVVTSATEISNQTRELAAQILDSRVSVSPDAITSAISANGK
jgi:major membrane immunogen (membrane-anchored lipoprotein)